MSATPKLTKKQKKSLAFREHKTSKRQPHRNDQRHKNGYTGMGGDAHFTLEDQDILDLDGGKVEVEEDAHEEGVAPVDYKEGNELQRKTSKVGRKSKGETKKEDVPVVVAVLKRKRRIEEEEDPGQGRAKKAKQTSSAEEVDNENKKEKTKQKFILFVGGFLA
jgi:nucleolar protein 6